MRFLLVMALFILGIGDVYAQGRPGTPPPAPPPRGAPPPPVPAPDETPVLTGLVGACVHPGDMLTIEGKNLDRLEDEIPALEVNGIALPLDVLNKTDERFVTRLPKDDIEAGRTYVLALADEDNPIRFEKTDLVVRFCPASAVPQRMTARTQDILIFAGEDQRAAILRELESREIEVIRSHTLSALDSILIVIQSAQAADLIAELRDIFPQVEIDLNSDLSPAKGPRLYAKDKIKWPDKGACVDEALKIPIGLIDGRIDTAHPAFAGQTIIEKNFLSGGAADRNHATAIASILIGNAPEQGFDGLLTGAKLYNAVALRRAPDDRQLASIEATLRGLDWLMGRNVRLINVSLAGKRNRALIKAFEKSLERGALVFAAAGNNGPEAPPVYPAAIDGVFAITAIDAANRIYAAANQGDYIDFAAPGVDIWSAAPKGGAYKSGTSYATAYGVAAAALHLQRNSALSHDLLLELFRQSAKDLGAGSGRRVFGFGLIQSSCI